MLLVGLLQSLGVRAQSAASGQAAIKAVTQADTAQAACDVLLIDWQMPELDGFESAARVDQLGLKTAPTRVLVTAFGHSLPSDVVWPAGFDGLLSRPVHASGLFDLLAGMLGDLGAYPLQQCAVGLELAVRDHAAADQVAQLIGQLDQALADLNTPG